MTDFDLASSIDAASVSLDGNLYAIDMTGATHSIRIDGPGYQ